MFEREIRDASFLKRWSIVRTLRDQSVAEHSFFVAVYANDICIALGLPPKVQLSALQYSLWHDFRDEIFTGDLPGPSKRGLLSAPGAREAWDDQLEDWSTSVFSNLSERAGAAPPDDALIAKLVVKLADWIDAAFEMATETQLGNRNCTTIALEQFDKACEAAYTLFAALGHPREAVDTVPFNRDDKHEGPRRVLRELQEGFNNCSLAISKGPKVAIKSL